MTMPSFRSPEPPGRTATLERLYEHAETRELVALVDDAAELVRTRGEEAFSEFRSPGGRWRHEETYIFVLDPEGNMLVHFDPGMEGRNLLDLEDVDGKPVIRGLIGAATAFPDKPEGWYHYQWPVPNGLLPRWKSSYVRLVKARSGNSYIVGSGMYNDRMERAFVVDLVARAAGEIERRGQAAFPLFHDRKGPFIAKDAYILVIDMDGIELVNPGFPNLQGRQVLEVTDTEGKHLVREMLKLVQVIGYGWVDYMWPKPGESVSTLKSTYVSGALLGDKTVVVGCGVYLADAPKAVTPARRMTASALRLLVREGADVFASKGEQAYAEFRRKGSRWFSDGTYFFVWTMDGIRTFHAADPALEGQDASDLRDVLGRPYGRMILEAAASPSGEGWVHYMYPEPGGIFPIWKSTFVKQVMFPSGKEHLVGCGVYNMQMEKAFIEDVVNRAATLIQALGKAAFPQLRDRTGPFVFMDTYVFVSSTDGVELVNAAQPSLEGKNLMDLKDLKGNLVVRDQIDAVMQEGSAWREHYWFKPGDNTPARKLTYVRKVEAGKQIYLVGSGIYAG